MTWLSDLHQIQPIAHTIGMLAIVCVIGMAIGSIRFRGIGLGTAGVLFAGILIGHFGQTPDSHLLEFVKEAGLTLFIFTIGLQLGPGFFTTFRQQGLGMNLFAAAIVLLGAGGALFLGLMAGFDPAAILGIFSGASTNTPSLGASTQTLGMISGLSPDRLALPALAYAVTYPAAIAGIIGTLVFLKYLLRIDTAREAADFITRNHRETVPIHRRTLIITNTNLNGIRIDAIPGRNELHITISRVRHGADIHVATDNFLIGNGDAITAIGTPAELDQFERIVGKQCKEDLVLADTALASRRVAVTDREVLGKTIGQLHLGRFDVAVTRVSRAGMEMSAVPGLRLQFGDQVQIVGIPGDLDKAAKVLGNSLKELNETHFIPFFIGIALGVALGTLPISVPGLPHPIQLGLAGGPLLVALILGRIGRIRRQVWHMPENTNLAFREFGISLFFAAVGLSAGGKFFDTVFSSTGIHWLLMGIGVTILPLVLIGLLARLVWKMNFMDISGLLAGSMTDPPALAFACNIAKSDAPLVAYATVYPLTTLLRILFAQILIIILFH